MIIVRLSSGLGNQLFQYTFAHYLKTMFNQNVFFYLNGFNLDNLRNCEINVISDNFPVYKSQKLFSNYSGIQYRIRKSLFTLNPFNRYITDNSLIINFKFQDSFTYYFDGYWQSDYYVSQIPDWRKLFIPNCPIPESIKNYLHSITIKDSVAIHIRRGDYFSPQYIDRFGVCGTNYYLNAIEYIKERVKNPAFLIFSDDLKWVKENLPLPQNTIFITNENLNSFWYIFLMSKSKHNIVSNSTFSWWGAYLNSNKSKIVISPDKWMLDSENTIALKSWIKIKV